MDANQRELEILKFWEENKTFEQSLEKAAPQGEFVFYDGPPFATGLPHHGSLLSSIIKDVIPRYKTMRGYRVRRRWGWDTHGLPIENLVEKELGLKTKKDIEKIGIAKFNETARSLVLRYVHDWKAYVERIGRWVDYENSYKTMDNSYIESVWWALKRLWDKELLYEGRKVLMYCPHDETPLAKAEIAADNTYKDITEEAVTVKFKVKNPEKHDLPANTFLLAWTTTPWTLPGNVALAVGSEVEYAILQSNQDINRYSIKKGDSIVLADSTINQVLRLESEESFKPIDVQVLGTKLIGLKYEPLFTIPQMQTETSHQVYAAPFVATGEGTGIVHTAVMYGEDDFLLGQEKNLPMVQMLNANGTYNDVVPEFLRGQYIKDAEKEIKKDLETRGLLFEKKNHTHSYPHCWRCGTPLIYNAVPSWFINIQKVKAKLLTENEKVNWVPEHLKHGRFQNIVANAPDWTISRNRFWASPLPIWKSKEGQVLVIGSLDELKQRVKKSGNKYFVMRHGEADHNVKNILSSKADHPHHLTKAGQAQVGATAKKLEAHQIDLIIASPYVRGQETAGLVVRELGLSAEQLVLEPRLSELDFGPFDGQSVQAAYHGQPGVETVTQVRRRVKELIYELENKYQGRRILLVTHDSPARELADTSESFGLAEARAIDFAPLPHNHDYELDLHRPYTDDLVLIGADGAEYRRIPEVVDCWVESGSMPFAEYHYPFENKAEFEKRAPGDFIAEYIAQTRTWFYYMHAMGVLLFDRLAFKNVVSTGTILAADGEKISKSKHNYTDPLELTKQYGSDALRLYLMGSPVMQAEDLRFRDEDVRDAHNRTIGILWNTFKFFDLYQKELEGGTMAEKSEHVLDRWILARLAELIGIMTTALEAYDTPIATRALRAFVDDYSTWYIRRSRERMKSEGQDKQFSLATQRQVLLTLAQLAAPIMPFMAESIWQGIGEAGSVHLSDWPLTPSSEKLAPLLAQMSAVRVLASRGLEARAKANLKVRQPLARATIATPDLDEALLTILAEELNVKEIVVDKNSKEPITLDTTLTPELEAEGQLRELVRALQDERKKRGLAPGQLASATLAVSSAFRPTVEKNLAYLKQATALSELKITNDVVDDLPFAGLHLAE